MTIFTTVNETYAPNDDTGALERNGGLCVGMTTRFLQHYLVHDRDIADCSPAGPDGYADPTSYMVQQSYLDLANVDAFLDRNPNLGLNDFPKLRAAFELQGLDIEIIGEQLDHGNTGSLVNAIYGQEPGRALVIEQDFMHTDGSLIASHMIAVVPDHDGTLKIMDPNVGLVSVGRENRSDIEGLLSETPEETEVTFSSLFTITPKADG